MSCVAPSTDGPPTDGPATDRPTDAGETAAERRSREAPQRLIYGRRTGPRLRPGRRRLLAELLPVLRLEPPDAGRLDPRACFATPVEGVRVEIGFGGGEHLEAEAAAHPELGFIGVEPFLAGVARLLAAVEARGLRNLRLVVDDARLLLRALADSSVRRVDILFPDPWPKARHHKRRIVGPATVAELARILEPGGELRLATDDPGYARWMLAAVLGEPRLEWLADRAADWRAPWPDHTVTRYERKALAAGRKPVYLACRRRPAACFGLA